MLTGTCGASATFYRAKLQPSRVKGELDLIGYDQETLVIVEVRTCQALPDQQLSWSSASPKKSVKSCSAPPTYFLRERRIQDCPLRFDVVAIENTPCQPPVMRLHKPALSPQSPDRMY